MKHDQSKGEAEASIRNAIIKFEQEFMGRGPTDVRAFILRDLVLVRLKGVLTPAERQLAKNSEGIDMVKRMRQNLLAQGGKNCAAKLRPEVLRMRLRTPSQKKTVFRGT